MENENMVKPTSNKTMMTLNVDLHIFEMGIQLQTSDNDDILLYRYWSHFYSFTQLMTFEFIYLRLYICWCVGELMQIYVEWYKMGATVQFQ